MSRSYSNSRRRRSAMLAVLLGASLVSSIAPPGARADVTPASVEGTVLPGDVLEVHKTVDVPEAPAKLDLFMIVDNSGSYGDDIDTIKSEAGDIVSGIRSMVPDSNFGLGTFVDYPFSPWGFDGTGDYAYDREQDLTATEGDFLSAVAAMTLEFGEDLPESQYESLFQAATGAGRDVSPAGLSLGDVAPGMGASFRADATKVIAITTDAAFHTAGDSSCSSPAPCPFPYPGPSAADTISALTAAGIKVIAIKAPGSGAQMDALAAATGGAVVSTGSSSAEIVEAILAGLEALTFDVTPVPSEDCPLVLSYDPPVDAGVPSGGIAEFDETITVPAGTSPGPISCTVDFVSGGVVLGTQTIDLFVTHGCYGKRPTHSGTLADDVIFGTEGPDVIVGLAGNDTIFGLGGDDLICGLAGDDVIFGDSGGIASRSASASDVADPSGNDKLDGGKGNDFLFGEGGTDHLLGFTGHDLLDGGAMVDKLVAGAGKDTCIGNPGPDIKAGCEA